jgi:preprotein translocase subunit SecD
VRADLIYAEDEMKKIAVIILSSLVLAGCHKPAASAVFQICLVVKNPSIDSVEMAVTNNDFINTLQVQKTPLLDATSVESAYVTHDVPNRPWVGITFTAAGAKQFAEITRQHIGDQLAIVVDGKLLSAPIIRAEISDGKADIAGNFTEAEAKALAKRINDAVKK